MGEKSSIVRSFDLKKLGEDVSNGRLPALDVILAAVLAVMSAGFMGSQAIDQGLPMQIEALYWLWGAAYFLPLAIRRTHTDLAFALTLIPHLLQFLLLREPTFGNLMVPIMVYTVAVHSPRKLWFWVAQASAVLGGIRWMHTWQAYHYDEEGGRTRIPASEFDFFEHLGAFLNNYILCLLVVTVAWLFGRFVVKRKEAAESERERILALTREQDQFQLLAAEQERSAIARDMHDIVAHSLAVIVVQSDGARYLIDQHPELDPQIGQAIATVGDTARDALKETRRLVGVLRSDGADAERAPAMTLAQIPDLVETMSNAGLQASYQQAGDEAQHAALPISAQTALYRVAQEGLTNVVKHAGPEARCLVRLTHSPDGVHLAIVDDGVGSIGSHRAGLGGIPGLGGADGKGHGIIGMRERMSAFGGELVARERMGGGFEVLAFLPAPGLRESGGSKRTAQVKGLFR